MAVDVDFYLQFLASNVKFLQLCENANKVKQLSNTKSCDLTPIRLFFLMHPHIQLEYLKFPFTL